jgi:alkylated DNA repair dioxygenase AlkB
MELSLFDDPEAPVNNNVLPKDGEALYYPNFLPRGESDVLLAKLLKEIKWKQEKVKMYGKMVNIPRLTAWYGSTDKDYTYSGIRMKPREWSETLLSIKKAVEEKAGSEFTSVLLNLYRNGEDAVGWHSDDERELGENPTIASVSLGTSRTFRFRHLEEKLVESIELTHGSLLIMKGETQAKWEHEVPRKKGILKPRINLTFRLIAT